MKAIILCGGQGTRLREHTEVRPKPMVEIGERPILWHIMKLYAHHGITDFILCLGYKGDVIRQYFLNYEAMLSDVTLTLGSAKAVTFHGTDHAEAGWKVTLVNTGENTMTGARLRKAARFLDGETVTLVGGDQHGGAATLTGVGSPSRYGQLECDGARVRSFAEKPAQGQGLINGGFFFFEPRFLDWLDPDENCVLERAPLERCAAAGQLHVFRHPGFWQCMDTYRDWLDLQAKWDTGRAPWKVWP
jgi:glucose-1-phosphate cytidylyltransferase